MLNRIKNIKSQLPQVKLSKTLISLLAVAVITGSVFIAQPIRTVAPNEIGVRVNMFNGQITEFHQGKVLVLPGVYQLHNYSLRDQVYQPRELASAKGSAPLQSIEGLSFGIDLTVRYALDPQQIRNIALNGASDMNKDVIEPAIQSVAYKTFAAYTVKEIFSSKRHEIKQLIEKEIKNQLVKEGVILRNVQIGKVDLPDEYRRGMENLLAEELASQKMAYTLELKTQQVKQSELEAQAEKVHRETMAEAAAREQIIAAKAEEEAMKHVLPFKEKQIQQRQLEAEAEKVARIRGAEAGAQAREIEANGEAKAREKLADAESYRVEKLGKSTAEQMEREGVLISKHPLLIQKTLADKLSDKVQVIIAAPPANGGFIGDNLLGLQANAQTNVEQ